MTNYNQLRPITTNYEYFITRRIQLINALKTYAKKNKTAEELRKPRNESGLVDKKKT